ncbi:hypothetical protein C0J52_25519 [Blattella germanica]|nr:hypothetical protein C0J52_25519 [Blattella germanica]
MPLPATKPIIITTNKIAKEEAEEGELLVREEVFEVYLLLIHLDVHKLMPQLSTIMQELTFYINIKLSGELDTIIGCLHQKFEKQWSDMTHIGTTLATVPQLLNSVQQLMEQIGALQGLFEDVEAALFHLEDMVETQELQERQLDHRFQFALYKEKKLVNLAADHADKVVQHELKQQKLLKERQEAFGQAFQQDVEEFKLSGSLPIARGPSLEEVTLDPADNDELDKFLNDENAASMETSSDVKNV